MLGIFHIGACELFAAAGFKPWSSWSLVSWVARITGVSHWCPVRTDKLLESGNTKCWWRWWVIGSLYVAGGKVKWYSHCENQLGSLFQYKICTYHLRTPTVLVCHIGEYISQQMDYGGRHSNPVITLLGMYLWKIKIYVHTHTRKIYIWMYIASLFIIAKNWKQPLVKGQLSRLRHI
jgi:hypothetical protein